MEEKTSGGKGVLVLAICGLFILLLGGSIYYKVTQKDSQTQSPQGFPPVVVETLTVAPTPLENKVSAVGSILSNESVTIKPEVSGKVNFIGFEEGGNVEKEAVLFKLDSELLDAEYQELKANYDYASRQYERAKRLKKDGVVPVEEFDERLRSFLNAKSRLTTLSTRLKKHKILAPFSGRVGSRMVSIGDYLAVGDPMVNLEDLSLVKVEFYIPQRYIQEVENGQLVRITVEPLSQVYEGSIYLIDPRVDPETRSAVIRAKVPNPDEVLKPGMFCTVTIVIEKKENVLMVPEEAVVSRGEKHFLYLVEEGKAVMKQVRQGIFTQGRVEIESGLHPGDQVIVAGLQKLSPGAPVREVKEGEGEASKSQ
jgi:membrane fusion protein (multidrug efflux system)